MTSTLKILEILEAAQIEQPRAKAIAAAIEYAIDERAKIDTEAGTREEKNLREWMMATFATKTDLAELRAELRVELREVKADLMKWMFLFWIGQTAVLGGLIKLLMH